MTTETAPHLLDVTTSDGKYRLLQRASGAMGVSRNGEPEYDVTGDKLLLSLAQDVAQLREDLAKRPAPLAWAKFPETRPTDADSGAGFLCLGHNFWGEVFFWAMTLGDTGARRGAFARKKTTPGGCYTILTRVEGVRLYIPLSALPKLPA